MADHPTVRNVARMLDTVAAAKHLGTPERFVRRLVAERRIRFYKIGMYVRFDVADLDAFILAGRVECGATAPHLGS